MLSKTHHALVDGISGVDIMSVLFDTSPEPAAGRHGSDRWLPRPLPLPRSCSARRSSSATVPTEIALDPRGAARPAPRGRGAARRRRGRRRDGLGRPQPAPASPYNKSIGPHRRFTWVRANLADVKAIKDELGGTVNDVVLATIAGALGKHLRRRGQNTDGLELKAMVPVSVRADVERGALGNRVAAMMAPLPVWCQDPVARLDIVREEESSSPAARRWARQVLTGCPASRRPR